LGDVHCKGQELTPSGARRKEEKNHIRGLDLPLELPGPIKADRHASVVEDLKATTDQEGLEPLGDLGVKRQMMLMQNDEELHSLS
jgi:hypothetical protein